MADKDIIKFNRNGSERYIGDSKARNSIAEEFNTITSYSTNDLISYNGSLYKFTSDHESGIWDNNEVIQTSIANEIKDVNFKCVASTTSLEKIDTIKKQLSTIVDVLQGKKVSIIGDSISSYEGYIPSGYAYYYPREDVNNVNKTWWYQLLEFCGATLEVNASSSGSRATNTRDDRPDFYDRCSASVLGNPDVIIVELGTNDSSYGIDLGNYDFTTAYTSLSRSTFATAYIRGIKTLQANFPSATIICVTLKMGNSYRSIVQKVADTLGCIYINANTYQYLYNVPGAEKVHPSTIGMKQVALAMMTMTPASDDDDTGWETIRNSSKFNGTIYYRKVGKLVEVMAYQITIPKLTDAYYNLVSSSDSPLRFFPPHITHSWPAGNRDAFGQLTILGADGSYPGGIRFWKYNGESSWPKDRYINFSAVYLTAY